MGRKYIDCRDYPGDIKCTVALSADTEEELLEAAIQHGVTVHGYEDTPEFRDTIRKEFKDGTAPGIGGLPVLARRFSMARRREDRGPD